jgi:hypothetical protein
MNTNSLLLELLISGFFAIACFRARAGGQSGVAMRPRDLLRLTSRLERLRQTRWQWFAMVLVIVFVRLQSGVPLIVELSAGLQFAVFLALPVHEAARGRTEKVAGKGVGRPASRRLRGVRVS